jgi:hypothetical protein
MFIGIHQSKGGIMRLRLFSSILLALTITLGVAAPAIAKTPLVGTMDLQFNLAWPGPSEEVPDWVGTVTIDGVEYGMAFFNTGTGKPFESQPSGGVVFFEETWVIYQDLHFAFEEVDAGFVLTEFEPGDVLLSGYDRGVVTLANGSYRMNGFVEEANGPYESWLGRQVHMSGTVIFSAQGAPNFAPGVFRLD